MAPREALDTPGTRREPACAAAPCTQRRGHPADSAALRPQGTRAPSPLPRRPPRPPPRRSSRVLALGIAG